MLGRLSGRAHEVLTAVVVQHDGRDACHLEDTTVRFARLSPEEIAWYADSGEPLDKAGAYGVQGLASRFVTDIDGSYSNVVGLPVAAVHKLLRDIGFDDIGASGSRIDRTAEQGYSGRASGDPFKS
jgi:septum formation protein